MRLAGAEIKGLLEVEDAWLDALVLESAHVTGPFFWRNIHKGNKDMYPYFPNKVWKPSLDLTDAKVGSLADEKDSWPENGGLILDGFVYDGIGSDAPTDAKTRLDWVGLQPDELGYLPQPYEQLIAVLRRMGHEHQVAEVGIAKQWDMRKHGNLGWWRKFRSWFLYFVVGYGYKPWRALGWMAALVIVGTLVFSVAHSANVLVPSDQEAYTEYEKSKMEKLPRSYPVFVPVGYSLDIIVESGIGKMLSNSLAPNLPLDLGQKSHWRLSERWPGDRVYWIFKVYSLVQEIVGGVLLLLLLWVAGALPAGLIKKD